MCHTRVVVVVQHVTVNQTFPLWGHRWSWNTFCTGIKFKICTKPSVTVARGNISCFKPLKVFFDQCESNATLIHSTVKATVSYPCGQRWILNVTHEHWRYKSFNVTDVCWDCLLICIPVPLLLSSLITIINVNITSSSAELRAHVHMACAPEERTWQPKCERKKIWNYYFTN